MLEIKNLCVDTKDNKQILSDFSLSIKPGDVHAIMGPNGVGKSTLSKVLMGSSDYQVLKGDILFDNESILTLETSERAKKGIFLVNQNPISIEGVTNSEFLKTALSSVSGENVGLYQFMKLMEKSMQELQMDEAFMHRSINQGFSGGERKKNEILQMKILKPKFIILDELDSGLDVDSLKVVCENVNQYLNENPDTMVLIITHYTRILEYIKPTHVSMMKQGKIVETSDMSLAIKIENEGYGDSKNIEYSEVGVNSMSGNDVYE